MGRYYPVLLVGVDRRGLRAVYYKFRGVSAMISAPAWPDRMQYAGPRVNVSSLNLPGAVVDSRSGSFPNSVPAGLIFSPVIAFVPECAGIRIGEPIASVIACKLPSLRVTLRKIVDMCCKFFLSCRSVLSQLIGQNKCAIVAERMT